MNNKLLTVIILHNNIWCLFFLIQPFAHLFSYLSKNILNDFFLSRERKFFSRKRKADQRTAFTGIFVVTASCFVTYVGIIRKAIPLMIRFSTTAR